ncbi:hypothetical protein P3W45_000947 [Vairimorpha bombi]|jgi:hypothetical protein
MKLVYLLSPIYTTTNMYINTTYDRIRNQTVVLFILENIFQKDFCASISIPKKNAIRKLIKLDRYHEIDFIDLNNLSKNNKHLNNGTYYTIFKTTIKDSLIENELTINWSIGGEKFENEVCIDKEGSKSETVSVNLDIYSLIEKKLKLVISKKWFINQIVILSKKDYENLKKYNVDNINYYITKYRKLDSLIATYNKELSSYGTYADIIFDNSKSDTEKKYFLSNLLQKSKNYKAWLFISMEKAKKVYTECLDLFYKVSELADKRIKIAKEKVKKNNKSVEERKVENKLIATKDQNKILNKTVEDRKLREKTDIETPIIVKRSNDISLESSSMKASEIDKNNDEQKLK